MNISKINLIFIIIISAFTQTAFSIFTPKTVFAQTQDSTKAEADRLILQGIEYYKKNQFQEALQSLQKALIIYQEIDNYKDKVVALTFLGSTYFSLGQYPIGMKLYQQSLEIVRQMRDIEGEALILNLQTIVLIQHQKYEQAINYDQRSLEIFRELNDQHNEAKTLARLGSIYIYLEEPLHAIVYYQKSLLIFQKLGDRQNKANILDILSSIYGYLGDDYLNLGQYQQAINYYHRALLVAKKLGDSQKKADSLNGLGMLYYSLGNYQYAIQFFQQSLKIKQEFGAYREIANTLSNLGLVYDSISQHNQAIKFYQQALEIDNKLNNHEGKANTLTNIGSSYLSLGKYKQAINFLQKSLNLAQEIGSRQIQAGALSGLGSVYFTLGEYKKAIYCYQISLAIYQEIDVQVKKRAVLSNMGSLLEHQNQTKLAIVFYKQSVNITESIRENIKGLPREQQESYIKTVEWTYRHLAELLLQQDRILEAQQVLDLLKVQELDDYLRGVRGTGEQLTILQPEREILAKYDALQSSAIELGKELTELREIPETERTPAQQQRIAQLVNLEEEINIDFNEFIDSPEILDLLDQLSRTAQRQNVDLADFDALRDDLRQLGNAVMLYPLILEDRLELVITTPDSPPLRRTVPVKREELNRTILEFRQALKKPTSTSNAKKIAHQLYQWLIKPLEADLEQAQAQNIIYAPDGQLRYIPLSALYDGEQWLIQKYRVNNITAKSFTEFTSQPPTQPQVLAAAFTDETITYPVKVGEQDVVFRGLPFAGKEVENLALTLSSTTKLIDKNFSLAAVKPKIGEHSIIHLATHAAFVPGIPEDSFILFGNGDRPNLRDIGSWTLNNVDLVVLSACETGVGDEYGNGEEILGLGYQFQNRGARAVMASLWQVSDGGTQALMNAFYAALSQGNVSKLEALQQAQIALITGDFSAVEGERGTVELVSERSGLPPSVSNNLDHPHYWAAFILIGNGL